jgi:predicted TIM-barrel fold metal-dependent hydrolase
MRKLIYCHPDREQALAGAHIKGLLTQMDRSGIDKALIMGLPWETMEFCRANNRAVAEVIAAFPDRFRGLGVIPHPAAVSRDDIRAMKRGAGLSGIKVIPEWGGFSLLDLEMEALYETLIEERMVFMSHIDHGFYDPQKGTSAYELFELASRYPELRILAPHLGGLLCLYGLYAPVAQRIKNIRFITSVGASMKMVQYAIDAMGEDFIVFGTDFPFNLSHDEKSLHDKLQRLIRDTQVLRKVAGVNLRAFLEWDA